MIEMTFEMLNAYAAAASQARGVPVEASTSGLAAVLAIVERELCTHLADRLEEHALKLRREDFRCGYVGIEYILGIEGAAGIIRPDGAP